MMDGAWVDNIGIQGICEMLNISITVLRVPKTLQKPIYIMTDSHFEEMSNTDKLCLGTDRPKKTNL